MLVPNRWPEVPPQWQGLDAQYTEELKAVPLYTGTLNDRQFDVAFLASAGQTNDEAATTLGLSPKTASAHRTRAFSKLGVSTMPQMLYVCYDSEIMDYIQDPREVELSPAGAIALKGIFLGYDGLQISNKMEGISREEIREELQAVELLLGAKNKPTMVRRAYQVGLCAPRITLGEIQPEGYRYE